MSESDENIRRVKDAIFAGRTFDAVKAHWKASGSGLVDAKHFVDKLEAQLRVEEPEKFTDKHTSLGCTVAFLSVFVVAGLAFFLLGARAIVSNLLFANGATTEEGVVVKHHGTPYLPWPTNVVLRPVLRPGRFEIELTPTASKTRRTPRVGTRLPILVRKDRPGEARVADEGLYVTAGMFCIIGGGVAGFAMLWLWPCWRAAKSRERKVDTTL